jgi:hypothetical protein
MAGLARLVRQVCLLREQGDAAGAVRVQEKEFATAVRDIRLAEGPEALPESELRAMFATEEQRVAEAVILSELLIPQLVGSWPSISNLDRPGTTRSAPGALPASAPAPTPAAGPPTIPDLLDAMLAAERPGRRRPPNASPEPPPENDNHHRKKISHHQ